MIKNLLEFVKDIDTFILRNSNTVSDSEDLVKCMISSYMINIGPYGIHDIKYFDCDKILDDILGYMNKTYTDDEILGYFLKYYGGLTNDTIHQMKLYQDDYIIDCTNVNIRIVERIHMSVKRRVFAQTKYTKSCDYINAIIVSPGLKNTIDSLHINHKSVFQFREFVFNWLLSHELNDEYTRDILHLVDLIKSLRSDINFIDFKKFPWNMIYHLAHSSHINMIKFIDTYLKKNKFKLDDLLNNEALLTKVVMYNMRAFVSTSSRRIVLEEKFIHNKSLTEISNNSYIKYSMEQLSVSRIQQLFQSAVSSICEAIFDGKSLFSGFEMVFQHDKLPDPVASKLLDYDFDDSTKKMLRLFIPNNGSMTLNEFCIFVYANPLLTYTISEGYDEGIFKANEELRLLKGIAERTITMLPKYIKDLGLSVRATNGLMRRGIEETETLLNMSQDQLTTFQGFGSGTIANIINTLKKYGITLK